MKIACVLLGVFFAGSALAADATALTIDKDGTLLRDGKPYRAIGINYFSAFSRTLNDPADTSYRKGFDVLVAHKIPFIRFMAGGFWPSDWKLYSEDKVAYFHRMDAFVKCAEEKGVGLIPSLFWYMACFPDLVDEPCSAWGDPNSKTLAFMRQYIEDVVKRYVNSPAIWAWELGNEHSLAADLPNAAEQRPPIHPTLGTRKERSAADDMTQEMIVTACKEFGNAIRTFDKVHPITTGHSLPRSAAHHMRIERSWTADSKDEFAANLIEVTPDPVNLISVHVYPGDKQKRFGQTTVSFADILSLCMQTSRKAGKALFVGEFGAPDRTEDGGPEAARKDNLEIIAALESTGVPLAALWVFDLSDQDSFINVTPTNARSYLLDLLQEANLRLHTTKP